MLNVGSTVRTLGWEVPNTDETNHLDQETLDRFGMEKYTKEVLYAFDDLWTESDGVR